MNPHSESGLSIWEILVLIAILFILAALAIPSTGGLVKGQNTQVLSNMKQLHLATQQMALDGVTTTNTTLGWPGDTGGRFDIWASNIVAGGYLSTNDLDKLLSAPGRLTLPGTMPQANTNAVIVYAVSGTTDGNAVFLTSANFTNTPTGGLPPLPDAKPFGTKGFVLFHQAGDGLILQQRQTGPNYTNLIGSFVPLCK